MRPKVGVEVTVAELLQGLEAIIAARRQSGLSGLLLMVPQRGQPHRLSGLQLAVEAVFLEATLQLVGAQSSPLSTSQADALQKLVFDWVLRGDKFVDPKHAELARPKEQVGACQSAAKLGLPSCNPTAAAPACCTRALCASAASAAARGAAQVTSLCRDIIGAMSRTRLTAIRTQFLRVHPAPTHARSPERVRGSAAALCTLR